MFCPKCGNQLPDGSAFCLKCGFRIAGVSGGGSAQQSNNSMSDFVRRHKKGCIIAVVAVIALIFILRIVSGRSGSASVNGGFSSPDDAVDAFTKAMLDQNEGEYLECFPETMRDDISEGIDQQLYLEQTAANSRDLQSPYRFFLADEDENLAFTVQSLEDMPKEDIEGYNENYGYEAKEGKIANVQISNSQSLGAGTATQSNNFTVAIGKIGRKWFILEPPSIPWIWNT